MQDYTIMNKTTIIKSDIQSALRYLTPKLPHNPIIVEAGAFNGQGTTILSSNWPQGTIHAFEPVPELFANLQQAVQHQNNVVCYPYALGASNGTAIFNIAEKPKYPGMPSQAGSLLKPKNRLHLSPMVYTKTIEVSTITLATWAQSNHINHINLLWLDVQGYALNVLKASSDILQSIQVIYTEVEFVEAYEHQYYYEDVKAWLEEQNFVMIACDFANQNDWFFGNVIFLNTKFGKE